MTHIRFYNLDYFVLKSICRHWHLKVHITMWYLNNKDASEKEAI